MTGYATPLRAVDAVETISATAGEIHVRAVKTVRATDPYMPGHFPAVTMFPAVFLLEALRQTVIEAVAPAGPVDIAEVRSARLLAPMLADTTITIDARITLGPEWTVKGTCTSSTGPKVATMTVTVAPSGTAAPAAEWPEPRAASDFSLAHQDIRAVIPVRHPMVLLDRATTAGDVLIAEKAVTGSEPCYHGIPDDAPPSHYAYPRALLLESFGQACALRWFTEGALPGELALLAAMRDCRFRGAVFPGDVIRHEVRLDRVVERNAFLSGGTFVNGVQVSEVGTLVAAGRPPTAVKGPA